MTLDSEIYPPQEELSQAEAIELAAVDPQFFCHFFFPQTVRQDSPAFDMEVWRLLESEHRYINLQLFRGAGKTTRCRLYTAKRIAYNMARTILYIGKSEGHAIRSINWIRRQVMYNRLYAGMFDLTPGSKWQDLEAEIRHGVDETPIWMMGMGITGSVRGINRDDFRPDLIVLDDVVDEENAATPEQRQKMKNLVYGAVVNSLAPRSEEPNAKIVMLQTPMHKEDVSTLALNDRQWKSAKFGCWTPQTADLPVDKQESSWLARYPSEELREDKRLAAERNELSVFVREMECRISSPETSAFKPEWLRFYDLEPEALTTILVVDPVPPPTDNEVAKGMHNKDFEALAVVGKRGNDIYLLEYALRRGHEPDWTITEFFRLAYRWKPIKCMIEEVAYQSTLSWLLKKAMEHQRRWWVIEGFGREDKRSKYLKIRQGLNGVAAAGHLWCRASHTDFIEQFRDYPDVSHDDLIEAVAIGVTSLQEPWAGGIDGDIAEIGARDEDDIPSLADYRGAP